MLSLEIKGPVFISVGEPSGDLYASHLVRYIRTKTPGLRIFAIGGENMVDKGVDVLMDYNRMLTFGFVSGILSSLRNFSIYKKIARMIYKTQPHTFIGVAYPGLNLLLCKYAKSLGCKVYYFLPPQIWAWGTFRKYFIRQWVDVVISVFPFEYTFYKNLGINTLMFKNPLFSALEKYKRKDLHTRIGFMPGSRKSEIKRNLSVVIELMKKIAQKSNHIEFSLILLPDSLNSAKNVIAERMSKLVPGLRIVTKNRYQTMKDCDLLVICSGTASLEAAAMNIPQVFFNHPAFIDYHLLRRFIKIKEFNLTNLYFKDHIVPSFISADTADLIEKLYNFLHGTFLIDE